MFIQLFIQELSRIVAPLTSMLKTPVSTQSTTRLGKGGVGVADNGVVDGGDDGGHNDEHPPR